MNYDHLIMTRIMKLKTWPGRPRFLIVQTDGK